jgi:hypothetical protein
MAFASLALRSTAVAPQSLLVPLQPQPQPFAVSAAGAVSALAAVADDSMFIAAAFCGRIRPLGRGEVEPSAALPEVLMAWRRARLMLRAPDALALSARTGCTPVEAAAGDAAAEDAGTGAFIAAGAGLVRRADGLLTDAALTVPVLPCSAIALRRFRASSRPERVALAVLSVACVITYLVNMEFAIRITA